MKSLLQALISMDVSTAPKLFWRRGKVLSMVSQCALYKLYTWSWNVSKQYGTKLRCYGDSLGEFGEHIRTKGMWKNIDSTFITSQVEASWGVGESPLYPDIFKPGYRLCTLYLVWSMHPYQRTLHATRLVWFKAIGILYQFYVSFNINHIPASYQPKKRTRTHPSKVQGKPEHK
jgi:hypothetical protein